MIPHSKPSIGREEANEIARVLSSGQIAQGREVERFEAECARAIGRKYGVAVSSGTAALHLALGALEVQPETEVAVPSYACAALITAIHLQQAKPVLCDIGADYNLDVAKVPAHCTYAIVPHLFGAQAAMPEGVTVIEDIAQSMGTPRARSAPIAITSFYATKLMTTGEGGMLFTDDQGLAEFARDRRDYDNRDTWAVRYPYKMTDIQAAMGRVQLRRLAWFIERRHEIAAEYRNAFDFLKLRLPNPENHVFFRYVVGTSVRADLQTFLQEYGIESKRPVYKPAHHYLGGTFPHSERAHNECLSLPIYPTLSEADQAHVIESVQRFFQ